MQEHLSPVESKRLGSGKLGLGKLGVDGWEIGKEEISEFGIGK